MQARFQRSLPRLKRENNEGSIKADWRMLSGRVEILIYSFSIRESQVSLLQATLAPATIQGSRVWFRKDTRPLSFWRGTDAKENALHILQQGDAVVG